MQCLYTTEANSADSSLSDGYRKKSAAVAKRTFWPTIWSCDDQKDRACCQTTTNMDLWARLSIRAATSFAQRRWQTGQRYRPWLSNRRRVLGDNCSPHLFTFHISTGSKSSHTLSSEPDRHQANLFEPFARCCYGLALDALQHFASRNFDLGFDQLLLDATLWANDLGAYRIRCHIRVPVPDIKGTRMDDRSDERNMQHRHHDESFRCYINRSSASAAVGRWSNEWRWSAGKPSIPSLREFLGSRMVRIWCEGMTNSTMWPMNITNYLRNTQRCAK